MLEILVTVFFVGLGFTLGVWLAVDFLRLLVNFVYTQWGEKEWVFFTEIAAWLYSLTGVNVAVLFGYGFFIGILLVFSATLLVIIYNLIATRG